MLRVGNTSVIRKSLISYNTIKRNTTLDSFEETEEEDSLPVAE